MLVVIHTHFDELKEDDVTKALQVMKAYDEVWLRDRLEDSEYSRILDLISFSEESKEGDECGDDGEKEEDK